ncbi:hypothetical protein SAMN05192580_0541 [Sphingomonas jatrophae]|uniref:Uncharacterized protein n=2 Tax=Sphingomonas jatrophae TaxID=1166337 RepID=A0A1I6JMK1_9SPHN|nr:hypothetical protein SAMN05192580_0541 [Sphingomonas jatrophae]
MATTPLPEGTDSVIDDSGTEIDDTVGSIDATVAAPMDSGAEADQATATTTPGGESSSTGGSASGGATSGTTAGSGGAAGAAGDTLRNARDQASQKAQDFKGQATDKLRAYAVGGKDKASETIQGFAKMLEDAADQVEEKVGPQYSGYARQMSQTLGGFASTIDEKDVDELFEQARDAVKKSPGIAIGAAAALGFVLARVIKAGLDTGTSTSTGADNDVTFTPASSGDRA